MGLPSYRLKIPLRFYWVFIGYRTVDLESDPYRCFPWLFYYHMAPLSNINLPTCSSDYWTGCFLRFEAERLPERRFWCAFDAINIPIISRSIRFLENITHPKLNKPSERVPWTPEPSTMRVCALSLAWVTLNSSQRSVLCISGYLEPLRHFPDHYKLFSLDERNAWACAIHSRV